MTPTLWVLALYEADAVRIRDGLPGLSVEWIDGRTAPCFSRLVNEAARRATGDLVLCASDRVLPTPEDLDRIVTLLQDGFGWVGLYRFAMFGFWKEMMRRIGYMDEDYGNGAEDGDWYFRAGEADIAIYESQEVYYSGGMTRWLPRRDGTRESLQLFYEKWQPFTAKSPPQMVRLRAETPRTLAVEALGPSQPDLQFRPHRESVLIPRSSSRLDHADWANAIWSRACS